MIPLTPNASFSRITFYDNCPKAYKFKYLQKVKELPRPVQKDKLGRPKVLAAERGSIIHDQCDKFINDEPDYVKKYDKVPPKELANIMPELKEAREQKRNYPDTVITEQKWYSDQNWQPVDKPTKEDPGYYLLTIVDCMILDLDDDTKARVCDIKSGKRYGNENKHQRQLQLYALAAFHRYPKLYGIEAELWYSDLGLIHKKYFSRKSIMCQQRFWDTRIEQMRTDTEFKSKPNISSCMFCAYGKKEHSNRWVNKTGDCQDSCSKEEFL